MNPSHACEYPGMRGSRPDAQKTVWTTLFYLFFLSFSVLSVFYNLQKGSNGFITGKSILFQGSRGGSTLSRRGGGPTFPEGRGVSNFFQGGIHLLIYIETHITCDFQKNVFPLRRFFLIPTTHVVVEVIEKYFDLLSHIGA